MKEKEWNIKVFLNKPIEKAHTGDIFAVQDKNTGDVLGRYVKVDRKKRNWQNIEDKGYVSTHDLTSLYSECKFIHYATSS